MKVGERRGGVKVWRDEVEGQTIPVNQLPPNSNEEIIYLCISTK